MRFIFPASLQALLGRHSQAPRISWLHRLWRIATYPRLHRVRPSFALARLLLHTPLGRQLSSFYPFQGWRAHHHGGWLPNFRLAAGQRFPGPLPGLSGDQHANYSAVGQRSAALGGSLTGDDLQRDWARHPLQPHLHLGPCQQQPTAGWHAGYHSEWQRDVGHAGPKKRHTFIASPYLCPYLPLCDDCDPHQHQNLSIVMYHSWTSSYHLVASIDAATNNVTVTNPIDTRFDGGPTGASGYVALENLDAVCNSFFFLLWSLTCLILAPATSIPTAQLPILLQQRSCAFEGQLWHVLPQCGGWHYAVRAAAQRNLRRNLQCESLRFRSGLFPR